MGFFLYIQERQCNGFRSRHCIVDDSKISDNLQAKGKRIFPTRFSSPHGFSFSFPSAISFLSFAFNMIDTPAVISSRLARPDDAVPKKKNLLGKAPNDILCKDAAGWRPAGSAVKAGEPFRKGRQPLQSFHGRPKIRVKGRSRFCLEGLDKVLGPWEIFTDAGGLHRFPAVLPLPFMPQHGPSFKVLCPDKFIDGHTGPTDTATVTDIAADVFNVGETPQRNSALGPHPRLPVRSR